MEEDSEVRVGRERDRQIDQRQDTILPHSLYSTNLEVTRIPNPTTTDDWGEKRRDLISWEAKVPLGVGIQQRATKTCATP